ncbi:uncharacterized protein LOC141857250 [Brevipalpus obovatus]|uniref:uncharacterized protein LOC141857250 n=1 Tax=Brevipalpus obovatus TaxID=246614 RepID=UPI003D9E4002
MRGSKDKRQLATSSFRLNNRRSTSPYLMEERSNPEFTSQLARFAYPLEVDTSPPPFHTPSSIHRSNGQDRSISSCSLNYRGSPYDLSILSPDLHPTRRNSDPANSLLMTAAPPYLHNHHAFVNPIANGYTMVPSSPMSDCDDQPLDMSNKKSRRTSDSDHDQVDSASRSSGGNGSCNSPSDYSNSSPSIRQQSRPSVITCAPSYFGAKNALQSSLSSSERHNIPSSPILNHNNQSYPQDSMASSFSSSSSPSPLSNSMRSGISDGPISSSILSKCLTGSNRTNNNSHKHHHPSSNSVGLGHKRSASVSKWRENDGHGSVRSSDDETTSSKMMILQDDSRSNIDEHFRRSLGEHYTGYTDVSMSVDDHFTKALGETWLKLKKESAANAKDSSLLKNTASIVS